MRRAMPAVSLRLSLWVILSMAAAVHSVLPSPTTAQGPTAVSTNTAALLPQEASVSVRATGLHQIPLRADVLSESQPNLRDVRIFDQAGNEVPWLLATAMAPSPPIAAVPLLPTEATRELRESEHERTTHHETYVLELPALPRGATGWDIVLATDAPELTRAYTVVERLDGGGHTARAGGAEHVERARGTVFRFQGPLREKLTIPLGGGPGIFEVTLEGEGTEYLTPAFVAETGRRRPPPATVDVLLTLEHATHDDGATVLTFRRPRGLVPSKLEIATATTTFHRRVQVRDLGPGNGNRVVGESVAYRIPEIGGAQELDIEISPPRGDLLEVRIEDGDAGPLDNLRITAVVEQPILVANLEGNAMLRFGGARLMPPSYDLQRLTGTTLGRRLDLTSLPEATVSDPRPNPRYDHAPALAWAMRPGGDVEAFLYRRTRSLVLDPGPEGLSRVRLTAEDLATLEAGLSDLRIVDPDGHQWPYLIELAAGIEDVTRHPERAPARGSEREDGSEYEVVIAGRAIALSTVTVQTTAAFVDRDFVLYGQPGPSGAEDDQTVRGAAGAERMVGPEGVEVELARGRLIRRPGSKDSLVIRTGGVRAARLRLVVHDGGDAPLPGLAIVAQVPVPELYVAAPRGPYQLLLGNPSAAAPTYEVRRARNLMLSVPSADAYPGPLLRNPDYLPPRRPIHFEDWLLWAVLILAILVLAALTLRATRGEGPGGSSEKLGQNPEIPPPPPETGPRPSAPEVGSSAP